jgi:hypothetical protein
MADQKRTHRHPAAKRDTGRKAIGSISQKGIEIAFLRISFWAVTEHF